MNLKDHPAIIVIPLIIAAAGFAGTFGYNASENRVKTLEARLGASEVSKDLQLPQLLVDLREASKQLSSQLETSRELTKAKDALALAQKRVSELEPVEARLRESETALKSVYAEVEHFTLKVDESRNLLGYEMAVAVHNINYSQVRVLFDNKSAELQVGGEVTANRDGKTCRLRLNAFRNSSFSPDSTPSSADFTFIVSK